MQRLFVIYSSPQPPGMEEGGVYRPLFPTVKLLLFFLISQKIEIMKYESSLGIKRGFHLSEKSQTGN